MSLSTWTRSPIAACHHVADVVGCFIPKAVPVELATCNSVYLTPCGLTLGVDEAEGGHGDRPSIAAMCQAQRKRSGLYRIPIGGIKDGVGQGGGVEPLDVRADI